MTTQLARFLDTGVAGPAWNMAVDEALLERCRLGLEKGLAPEKLPVTFRVYAWSPPTVSLGRGQSAARDLDLERLAAEGFGLCRRLTGGRAVLHDRELTYSLTGPAAVLGKGIEETYRRVSLSLARGLRRLGVEVDLAPPSGRAYTSQGSCFATASVWELGVGGRKVVGSAQCREGGAVLQHGSVLFVSPEERLASLLRTRSGNDCIPANHAVGLHEVLGREVSFPEVAVALQTGLEEELGLRFREEVPREDERCRAEEIAAFRYANPAWTLLR